MTSEERITALEKEIAALKLALRERLVFKQAKPAKVWKVKHSLEHVPFVYVLNSKEMQVFADIKHVSNSEIEVSFFNPVAGTAYLL